MLQNSGMFCFSASVMEKNFKEYAPNVWSASEKAMSSVVVQGNISKFDETEYTSQPDISIDYAVMEKAEKIILIPAKFGWSDVGNGRV